MALCAGTARHDLRCTHRHPFAGDETTGDNGLNGERAVAEDENRHELVCSFADQGYQDAIQIRQLVQLLRRQNEGSINAQLNEAGAGQAAGVARNALIANLVLLVSRAHAHIREGDQHVHRAFELLNAAEVKAEFDQRGSKHLLNEAIELWGRLQEDERRRRIKHFRDKFTAHLGAPEDIPFPQYDELFSFALETTRAMDLLARGTGVRSETVDAWDESCERSSLNFWGPWIKN